MRPLLKSLVKWIVSSTCLVLGTAFALAWACMYRGEPWKPVPGAHKGVVTVAYGTESRSDEIILNGNGVRVSHNPSAYSYSGDAPAQWRATYRDVPPWNWCGTGRDEYRVKSEGTRAGFQWGYGTWIEGMSRITFDEAGTPQISPRSTRAHFTLLVPHWALVSLAAILPLLHAGSIVRRRNRIGEGCCSACGYNLTGNISGVCPECGKEIAQANSPGSLSATA